MNMKLWVAFIDLEGPPGEEHITSTDCGVLLELIDNYLFIEDLTMCKAQWGLQDWECFAIPLPPLQLLTIKK